MKRVLITGAAGDIGSRLRLTMAGRYRLRFSDRRPDADPRAGEEFIGADISDAHAVASLMRDVDAVVHLGGASREAAWQPVLDANITGTYNVFEAARAHGVPRVVFASPADPCSVAQRVQGGDFAVIEEGGGAPLARSD